jgi:hypothetical protein
MTIATLAIIAPLVIRNWGKVKEFFSAFWGKIQPIWEKFMSFVKGFWNTISAPFKAIGNLFGKFFGDDSNIKIESKQKKIIEDISGAPLKNNSQINSTKTQNNNFAININGKDVADPKEIKNEIQKMLDSRDSGALYDFAAAY